MKVSGFTFVRNAIKFDYPVLESIRSVLPLCDEVIVAVGNSEDDTRALIESIGSDKIRIIDTIWDDSLREGGKVLAVETNKAFHAIDPSSDWAIYIQADEVIHEKYYDTIRNEMRRWKDDQKVKGLVFDYLHFYGSYDFVGNSRRWYRREVRIIRNDKNITSYRDAQGFRINGEKIPAKKIKAEIYHYGWVKHPKFQQSKQESFHRMWHDDDWMKKNIRVADEFDYKNIDSLALFKGSHPLVMQERVSNANWKFSFDPVSKQRMSLRYRLLNLIQKLTGWKPGEFKNYRII
jgi:glycosyltransferase involved in cell wall biosynthesis